MSQSAVTEILLPTTLNDPADRVEDRARPSGRFRQLGTDTAYVLATLPWTILGLVVVLALLSVALPLVALGIGVPLAAAALATARGLAAVERGRLVRRDAVVGHDRYASQPFAVPARPRTGYGPAIVGPRDDAGPWRRWVRVLADGQSWLDALHALTAWIVSIATACVTLTWWVGALGGLTAWVWDRYLPTDDGGLDGITGAGRDALELVNSVGFRVAGGVVLLLTLLPMTRAMANLQAGYARLLVGDQRHP
ncbi:sensor domain-containing protein [Sanguibacter sp. 25GB23B1]|uniref:sensor domain-containing protein n=1 Tax=unclassified Sanguibacter TaxID=2645534 RepID=UPI0032AE8A78